MSPLDEETLINRIARIIAATRFPFVDQETWSKGQQTLVNDEVKKFSIATKIGVLYPNIVITNPDGTIRELGTVETKDDITIDSIERWRELSDVAPHGRKYKKLFLYVPEGTEEKTQKILEENNIDYDGIRAYRVEPQTLRITPYITRNDEYDHIIT
jgi:hypothetical protein